MPSPSPLASTAANERRYSATRYVSFLLIVILTVLIGSRSADGATYDDVVNDHPGDVERGLATNGYVRKAAIEKKTGELESENTPDIVMLERQLGVTFSEGYTDANDGINKSLITAPLDYYAETFNQKLQRNAFDAQEPRSVIYIERIDPDSALYRGGARQGDILLAIRDTNFSVNYSDWKIVSIHAYRALGQALYTFLDTAVKRERPGIDLELIFVRNGVKDHRRIVSWPAPIDMVSAMVRANPIYDDDKATNVITYVNLVPATSWARQRTISYPAHMDNVILQIMVERSYARLRFAESDRREELRQLIDIYAPSIIEAYHDVCKEDLKDVGRLFRYTRKEFNRRELNLDGSHTDFYNILEGKPILVHNDLYQHFEKRFHALLRTILLSGTNPSIRDRDEDYVGFVYRKIKAASEMHVATEKLLKDNNCGELGRNLVQGMIQYFEGRELDAYGGQVAVKVSKFRNREAYKIAMLSPRKEYFPSFTPDADFISVEYVDQRRPAGKLRYYEIANSFYIDLAQWKNRDLALQRAALAAYNLKVRGLSCKYTGYSTQVYFFDDPSVLSAQSRNTLTRHGVGEQRANCPLFAAQ